MTALAATSPRRPLWLWIVAGLGLVWNLYGVYQFQATALRTPDHLMTIGMSREQALVYAAIPLWMTAAFAAGVLGGVAGSALMLARSRFATPVFAASLAGYIVLYIGDITEGVFAVMGTGQVVVLSIVVLIAAGLLWASHHGERNGEMA